MMEIRAFRVADASGLAEWIDQLAPAEEVYTEAMLRHYHGMLPRQRRPLWLVAVVDGQPVGLGRDEPLLLKVAFPTGIRNRRATYEIQFGTIERPTHRNTSWEEAAFEVPAQRWADLSDAHYGVALLADCKHGYSVLRDTLWLSLLKGAIDPDPDADRGEHHFTYSVMPHAAGLDDVRQAAYSLTRPLFSLRERAHPGTLPARFSLASVGAPRSGVLVETAKWTEDEDEDALILRLYEADGGACAAGLHLGVSAEAVDEVDLLERNPRPLALKADGTLPLVLRAHEVKTLRVRTRP